MSDTSQASIAAVMRQALALAEPSLDTTIGTPARAIIDVLAAQVSLGYVNSYLTSYNYDVDSKSGSDLDNFLLLFGFTRYPAKRASGQVTFARQTYATQDVFLSSGTQVQTFDGSVTVGTSVPALLPTGSTEVTIPVQALVGGSAGNVAANTLVNPLGVSGFSSVTNQAALTGGTDAESDAAFRQRFKTTVFRNMSGTESMYLGISLDNGTVTRANVIGAAQRWREQVQVVNGVAYSSIPDAIYVWPNTQTFGALIDAGQINVPGVQYTFNATNPSTTAGLITPVIDVVDTSSIPDGVYDLAFKYTPKASRNVPSAGINNRVDIYVDGINPTQSSETLTFLQSNTFSAAGGGVGTLSVSNFERVVSGAPPEVGNYFVKYNFVPVIDASNSGQITIGGITYTENVDYYLVADISPYGGTYQSNAGIEWVSNGNGAINTVPADNTQFTLTAVYNSTPRDVAVSIEHWQLVTDDFQVHAAKQVLLNLFMAAIIQPGYSLTSVQAAATLALSAYIDQVGYVHYMQVSELVGVLLGVAGVQAARFLTSADATNYALQTVSPNGTVLQVWATNDQGVTAPLTLEAVTPRNVAGGLFRAQDVVVGSDSVPVLNSLTLIQEAQTTFVTSGGVS
jgi:hypothetical protein